jgi:hypothetical protein
MSPRVRSEGYLRSVVFGTDFLVVGTNKRAEPVSKLQSPFMICAFVRALPSARALQDADLGLAEFRDFCLSAVRPVVVASLLFIACSWFSLDVLFYTL